MSARQRIITLIAIMVVISVLTTGFTLFFLYRTAFEEEERRLVETVESQARILEAMARFDALHGAEDLPGGARAATLAKINEAHNNYEQAGMTMEFALAERKGDWILFLIRHRHGGLEDFLTPVRFDSQWAEPMRMALSGKSGTVIGRDYRGTRVLAAFEPVAELNLGIVAKIDMAEIRAPFIREGAICAFFALLVVGIGIALAYHTSEPMLRTIENQNEQLRVANQELQREIDERVHAEHSLKEAHHGLEVKVRDRTAALSDANLLLQKEILERQEAERELKKNESMLKKIFDGILDPLILLDREMRVLMMNRAAVEYYGTASPQTAIGGHCFQELMGEPDICSGCNVAVVAKDGQPMSYERKGVIDPERIEKVVAYPVLEEDGRIASIIARVSDITEKKLFERQLIQREKLAALGVMVSSMAHEINNPNSFISFNIPILRDYVREMMPIIADYAADKPDFELCNLPFADFEKDIVNLLSNIQNGSKRISTFISNLREYSHDKSDASRISIDLRYAIESVLSICQSNIKKSVKQFVQNVPDNLPTIYAQPYAIEQILINFLVNSCHAADKDDAWIRLDVTVEENGSRQLAIAVSDNGQGMDERTLSKIFDPFYTTKSPEGGTGLGLFVCHTLAQRMDGRIEVSSRPGEGSRFVLVVPVEKADAVTSVAATETQDAHGRLLRS